MSNQKQKSRHTPVLVTEVLDVLSPKTGESYLDLTAGYGGHGLAVLEKTNSPDNMVLIDRDGQAISALSTNFARGGTRIIHSDFLGALKQLYSSGQRFDMVFADLGVSSPHLEDSERGFSFRRTGPLDMRMDGRQEVQANQIVNHLPETELADVLSTFGQEPRAKAIAAAITRERPIKDTAHLAAIIAGVYGWRGRRSKIDPATRSFQAIRIAVNDELAQLEQGLPLMAGLLADGGRLAIISFHSLEDKLVKNFLAEHSGNRYDAELKLLTKKPLTAGRHEIVSNPRARSAKLRAAAKIKTK